MTKYKTIFFSLDGDYVSEGDFTTREEAEDYLANIGSRWIFYPLGFVCTRNNRVLTERSHMKVKSVVRYLKEYSRRLDLLPPDTTNPEDDYHFVFTHLHKYHDPYVTDKNANFPVFMHLSRLTSLSE